MKDTHHIDGPVTLGLSFDYHDSAAVILRGNEIVAAGQEERFTRRKHDPSLPSQAIDFCLERAACRSHDIERVVFYENSFEKFARILRTSAGASDSARLFRDRALRVWMADGKLEVGRRIAERLGLPEERISFIDHHRSHAASAFYCSPFERAAVITLDGVGEFETGSVSVGEGVGLRKLYSINLPHSLGLLYSALTAYLGFEVNEGEYKVMGMAAFGEPSYYNLFRSLVVLEPDGTFKIDQGRFNFLTPVEAAYNAGLVDLLGTPRKPESKFSFDTQNHAHGDSKRFADMAASIQKLTEDIMVHVVSRAVARTGISDVCLAGGCALNSLANARIVRECGVRLFVQPAAGDAGGALGAALDWAHGQGGQPRGAAMTQAYLGRQYDAASIARDLASLGVRPQAEFYDEAKLAAAAAELIAAGAVVGWFQNGAEWGPRALGARSILANPTIASMQSVVNQKIKFREPFRPFAPAVLSEQAERYFEIPGPREAWCPENFMLQVCGVRSEARALLPATTHVDGSARVQTVRREANPLFYRLIEELGRANGVPVVLNTSFNLRGEPIVETPVDAIKTFAWSDMDYLFIGPFLVKKEWPL